jgi:hypothetical protein
MIGEINLNQIERNVFRDYLLDGLSDTMFGVFFLIIGLLLPSGKVAPFIVFPIVFFVPLLIGLKKRFTYPRTGYVELRQSDPGLLPWFTLGSLVLGLIALIGVLIVTGDINEPANWYRWMPIFFGIWMAGIFLGLGSHVRLVRYYVVAGVAMISGPAFVFLSLVRKLDNIGLFLVMVGAVLLICGVFAFIRFLRKYPLPVEGVGDVTN